MEDICSYEITNMLRFIAFFQIEKHRGDFLNYMTTEGHNLAPMPVITLIIKGFHFCSEHIQTRQKQNLQLIQPDSILGSAISFHVIYGKLLNLWSCHYNERIPSTWQRDFGNCSSAYCFGRHMELVQAFLIKGVYFKLK